MTAALRTASAVLAVAWLTACGSKVSCPQTTAVITYSVVQPVFEAKCTGCHATARTGDDRHGAPDDSNYDTYTAATHDAKRAAQTVISGSMPYGGYISDADACTIQDWVTQGTKP